MDSDRGTDRGKERGIYSQENEIAGSYYTDMSNETATKNAKEKHFEY